MEPAFAAADIPMEKTKVVVDPQKGRCVIANAFVHQGETVAFNHIVKAEVNLTPSSSVLNSYLMSWNDQFDCIALGVINLLNHSSDAGKRNVSVERDFATETMTLVASDILEGEELLIDYEIPLWFEEQ